MHVQVRPRPATATRGLVKIVFCVLVAFATTVGSAAASSSKEAIEALPEQWQVWLKEEVYPLITKDQIAAFVTLETEAQRKAFAERLWLLWGRQAGYGSSFRGIYQERLQLCRAEFGNTTEDRARVLLINGPPAIRHLSRCPEIFNPLELWAWPYIEGVGEGPVVCFYQSAGMGRFRMWLSGQGMGVLYNTFGSIESMSGNSLYSSTGNALDRPQFRCPEGDTLMALLYAAERWSSDPSFLQAMHSLRDPEKMGPESRSARFMEFSALLDKDAEPLPFTVAEKDKGRRGGLVDVGFEVSVPRTELGTTPVGDIEVVQLDVVGEITRDDQMVDRFRYLFSVPAAGDELSLVMERSVRPGDYTLRLKIEDVHSDHGSVQDLTFFADPDAVVVDETAIAEERAADVFEVPEDIRVSDERPLRLVGPGGEAISGVQRFEAVTTDKVQRVRFLVNGDEILTKNRAPFDVDLDLGELPRLTTVTAVGFDAEGREVDREALSLNVGRERFYVRLEPISATEIREGHAKARVELNIPGDTTLEKLELMWNDATVATLFEPPFEAPVSLSGSEQFGFLRAVATLTDGSMAEDVMFVNAPQFGSVVDVVSVELPVSVMDRDGKPVENLTRSDFTILEDGVPQEISHFALNRELPVRMGIVIDSSGSMETTMPTVQRVVMGFLRKLLRPSDRAFIEAFSDEPDLLAPFTADFSTLENALLALYPDRATSLYDSMIMGLFQFSGVRGRKAMVVLTDGEDTASKSGFDDVLGYAQRNSVTIYTVGIDLPTSKLVTRWQLSKVAEVTGGRVFFVSRKSDLDSIYEAIDHELRTQYLLTYTSSSTKPADELRKVEVEVARPKVKVRTLSGYYPVGS